MSARPPFVLDWQMRMAAYPFSAMPDHLIKKKRRARKRVARGLMRAELPYPVIAQPTAINPARAAAESLFD